MRKENKRLNLNDDFDSSPSTPVEEEFEKLDLEPADTGVTEEASTQETVDGPEESKHEALKSLGPEPEKPSESSSDASDVDDEYGAREAVENRLLGSLQANDSNITSAAASEDDGNPQPKLGKAKAKRAKKAARQEAEVQAGQEIRCAACNESFPSKRKLFAHIKELNHAQPVQPVPRTGKGKNKKR